MLKNKDGDVYVPLQYANYGLQEHDILYSKYKMVNLDYSDWKNFFSINRNTKREERLFYDILNLKEKDEFIFMDEFGLLK